MFANHRVLCQDDKSTKHWLAQLLKNIETMGSTGAGAGAGQQSLKGAQGTKLAQPVAWGDQSEARIWATDQSEDSAARSDHNVRTIIDTKW